MKLTRLEIQQLPGIQPGFTLDGFSPGINLVTGPNAIGKSSLIRALRYLVAEPEHTDPAALSLSAEFENGGHWRVTRTGKGYGWTRDGQSVARPPFPERDFLHCYWLTMEDLIQVGVDDRQLVDQLRQALAGGYDLPALRQGVFDVRPRIGNSEAARLREANGKVRRVETDYQQLQRREAALPELEQRIEKARQADREGKQFKQALTLLELIAERHGLEAALAALPDNMEALRGNELARLAQLEETHAALQRQRQAIHGSFAASQARLRRTGLEAAWPLARELRTHEQRLDHAVHQRSGLADRLKALDQARVTQQQALAGLGGGDRPPTLQPAQISRAEQLANELKQKQLACQDIEARLQNVTRAAPSERDIERHTQAVRALMAWLAVSAPSAAKLSNPGTILAGVGGVSVVIAAFMAQAWWALAAGGIVLVGALWSLLHRGTDWATKARHDFEQHGLDGPSDWTTGMVVQTRDDLWDQLQAMRLNQQRALAAAEERERLQRLNVERDGLEQQKRTLADELGFDPSLTALGVDHFVRHVRAYQEAAENCQAIEAEIERLEPEIAQTLATVRDFLSQWRIQVDADPSSLRAALADLDERTRAADTEHQAVTRLDGERVRVESELDACERDIDTLYREAGLEPGARHALERSCAQWGEWKTLRQQCNNNQVRQSEHRRELAVCAELIERAENGDRDGLARDRDEAERAAAGRDELMREASDVHAEIRSAGGARVLEQAMAEVDQCRVALEDRLDEQLFAEAGRFLLDEVESEHRSEHEPEVLRDARQRFARFTHHAWDVELHGEALTARDLKLDAVRRLEDLSSGTRMQLLLAVRLAWTHRLEQGRLALPLFLDEALTTSDEHRFAAVVESLAMLVREEGRQVFYLSARRQELALWEAVTGERPHHIDLAQVRRIRHDAAADDYKMVAPPSVPSPEGKSVEAWAAELGVPLVAPMQPAGMLPAFYLLRDDPALLHHLMQGWQVATVAQLAALLNSPAAGNAIPEATQRVRLQARTRAAVAWFAAWGHGRGRPVDRIVLEQSDAVSETYIDEVTALAEQLNGDAAAIIERLEGKAVSGFRSRKIDELRAFFEQRGYLRAEQPLDAPGRERETLLKAGRDADPEQIRRVVHWLETGRAADAKAFS